MTNDRLRIPGDAEYFHAVGVAVIAFARLEWTAVWCCERLQAGYLKTLETKVSKGKRIQKGKTAGDIAADLRTLSGTIEEAALREELSGLAADFSAIVTSRNGLMHGKPGTDKDGSQRLFRHGSAWTIEAVNDFADTCAVTARAFNKILYGALAEGKAVKLQNNTA